MSSGHGQVVDRPLEAFPDVHADVDLDVLLSRAVGAACEQTGARHGFVGILDEAGDIVEYVAHGITHAEAERRCAAMVRRLGAADRFPPDRPVRFRDPTLVAPIGVGGAAVAVLQLGGTLDGLPFTDEDEAAVSAFTRVMGDAVRHARTPADGDRRREWAEVTAELAESLHPPVRLIEPLNRIVEGARRVAHARLAAVVRCRERGFDVAATDGPDAAAVTMLLEEHGGRIRRAQLAGGTFVAPYGESGTVVGMPLAAELDFEGVLLVALARGGGSLPTEERELLRSFTTLGSFALDRAMLVMERQQQVVAADRDRIARDLHDVVIQRLFATGMRLRAARRAADPAQTHEAIDTAVVELEATMRDIRSTIFELQHGQEASLRAGVTALIREYADVLGFTPTLYTWGPVNSLVGRPLADQAMAVLREALSNCVKHAAASTCAVEVTVVDHWLTLRVTDDGRGPGDDAHESGLRNLRLRAEELGGALRLEPRLPRGTRLVWRVPTTSGQ